MASIRLVSESRVAPPRVCLSQTCTRVDECPHSPLQHGVRVLHEEITELSERAGFHFSFFTWAYMSR